VHLWHGLSWGKIFFFIFCLIHFFPENNVTSFLWKVKILRKIIIQVLTDANKELRNWKKNINTRFFCVRGIELTSSEAPFFDTLSALAIRSFTQKVIFAYFSFNFSFLCSKYLYWNAWSTLLLMKISQIYFYISIYAIVFDMLAFFNQIACFKWYFTVKSFHVKSLLS
jgi:hypothetical protein